MKQATRKLPGGRCPAKTRRNILFCSAVISGVCKYGFNAIDRKGHCYLTKLTERLATGGRVDTKKGKGDA